MKAQPPARPNEPRAAKQGERTGTTCPICGDPVLRQENTAGNGKKLGNRLVCSKRGCPYQAQDH